MRLLATLVLVAGLALGGPLAAEIRASVDRDPVRVDESFTLTYLFDGPAVEPNFAPLQTHFEVLQSNRISSVEIENGVARSQLKWQLNLMPRRAGVLIIPPIRFGAELSEPVQIRVLEASAAGGGAEEIFLEVAVDAPTTYVQAQVLYTLKLFRSVSTTNASLTEPEFTGGDAVVRKLEQDASYEAWRDGKRYSVFERKYAVFPQQSGTLRFEPLAFRGDVRDRSWRMRARRATSEALTVEVLPRPDGVTGAWLPARRVELAETLPGDTQQVRAGEAVTRTVTLVAEGLTAAQLPPVSSVVPDQIKTYPDQPVLEDEEGPEGIVGVRQEKTALLPTRPGVYTLPEVRVPWFDTQSAQPRVAVLAAREIRVLPAVGGTAATLPPTAPAAMVAPPAGGPGADPISPRTPESAWRWIAIALAAGWALTLGLAVLAIRRLRVHAPASRRVHAAPLPDSRAVRKALRAACLAHDPVAARDALAAWARGHRTTPGGPVSPSDLAGRYSGSLGAEIDRLNRALYGAQPGGWRGDALWESFDAARPRGDKRVDEVADSALSPL